MRRLALLLAVLAWAGAARAQDIAITFDDLPAHARLPAGETRVEVVRRILVALKAADIASAHGFVNGVQVEREPASERALDLWREAGHPLANHTWSHPNLDTVGAEAFEADIARNEPALQARMDGADWKWFRYPFLAEGQAPGTRARVRRYLAAQGYRVASVTLSFDDWAFNDPFARCSAQGDAAAIADLERRYLDWARLSLAYSRNLSQILYGRDIPYVLLMHAGAFDARMLPRLLADYRAAGVRFVSLETAERDPFYRADREVLASDRPATLEAEMTHRGLPLPPRPWRAAELEGVCR